MLMSEKKALTRNKEGNYIIVYNSFQEKDVTLVNIFGNNIGAPKYIKQMLMDIKWETDNNTVIVENFNTPLTSKDRSSI